MPRDFSHSLPEQYLEASFKAAAYTPDQQEFLRWIYANWQPGQLADWQIEVIAREAEMISPFVPEKIRPTGAVASYGLSENNYDVRLGRHFKKLKSGQIIDTGNLQPLEYDESEQDFYDLEPGKTVLGVTEERLWLPSFISAKVENKSSLARLFLDASRTTSLRPGVKGLTTLEITNHSENVIRLHAGMGIASILFEKLSAPVRNGYHEGRYCGQGPAVGAQI